jgi:hypothetical protein
MATKRSAILNALAFKLKEIDGSGSWASNLFENVFVRLKFWDEVDDYPSVYLNIGNELREYLPANFKWGYLTITVRIYVEDEEPESELEKIFCDIETVVDANGNLEYETGKFIEDMRIMSITTDEGLLHPIGVGENLKPFG